MGHWISAEFAKMYRSELYRVLISGGILDAARYLGVRVKTDGRYRSVRDGMVPLTEGEIQEILRGDDNEQSV